MSLGGQLSIDWARVPTEPRPRAVPVHLARPSAPVLPASLQTGARCSVRCCGEPAGPSGWCVEHDTDDVRTMLRPHVYRFKEQRIVVPSMSWETYETMLPAAAAESPVEAICDISIWATDSPALHCADSHAIPCDVPMGAASSEDPSSLCASPAVMSMSCSAGSPASSDEQTVIGSAVLERSARWQSHLRKQLADGEQGDPRVVATSLDGTILCTTRWRIMPPIPCLSCRRRCAPLVGLCCERCEPMHQSLLEHALGPGLREWAAQWLNKDKIEQWDERAAIREADGRQPRRVAERLAFFDVWKQRDSSGPDRPMLNDERK